PVTRPRKKEGMVVKLVPILHSSAVDFGGHTARIDEWAGIDGQLVAPLTNFERSLTGRSTFTPLECQSKPSTQPSAWNQNGSERRRSSSSGPRSKTTCVAISRASRAIRVKSH